MSTPLDTILSLLPKLDQSQLAIVRAFITDLSNTSSEESLLYEVVSTAVRVKMPFSEFAKSSAYKTWAKGEPTVMAFLNSTFPECQKKLPMVAILRFLIDLLRAELVRADIPVTLGTISSNLNRIPEIFSSEFPGYAESGALSIVKARLLGGKS